MNRILKEVRAANEAYAKDFGDKSRLPMPPARQFTILTCMDARLGTKEWFVIHHTDCGMETFTDAIMRNLLAKSLETAKIDAGGWHDVGKGPGSTEGEFIDWLTIGNLEESVVDDVRRLRNHPLVPRDIPVYGYIYDVKTGRLIEVPEATEVGASA